MRKAILAVAVLMSTGTARATETENLGIRALPGPGKVTVDGKFDDWDLSGGVFVCGDVENQRDKFAVWIHAMYDAQNLYLLARWIDETPMNNPGQAGGSYGFAGDCLQVRLVTANGTAQERGNHFTCWRDRNGKDAIYVERGKTFKDGTLPDAKSEGARQAFANSADGKGYVQEIALPWKLLSKDGQALKAGDSLTMTVEPNFTIGAEGRLTLKDIFKPGLTPDRVFTFMSHTSWGTATLERKGRVEPGPVRLADAREFPVRLENGLPAVNWAGLVKSEELRGFKAISFDMPEDGYLSLHLLDGSGQVVRQLLNAAFMTKGKHEVKWDGLTTMNWRTPGEPAPPGAYTWRAIRHKGIGLRLCGWACNAGSAPWDSDPKSNWGGDHGVPTACAADAERVFLAWSGAEAGKALLACDLQGNVLWKNSRQGMAGAELVAVDGDLVYAVNWGPENTNYVYRVHADSGSYAAWNGDSPDLMLADLYPDAAGRPKRIDGLAARDGRLYLSFTAAGKVAAVDVKSRKVTRTWDIPEPRHLYAAADKRVYVVSAKKAIVAIDPTGDKTQTVVKDLQNATGIFVDKEGQICVGLREPDNQVKVFSPTGKPLRAIGRPGGRALLGKWQRDGMAFIEGITIDAEGKLWVAEADQYPKRISAWDFKTGAFVKEFFGPTSYGALGGAVNPVDPHLIVGHGCEWRLDPKTGRDACLGTFTRDGMSNSRFGTGPNGRLYLAVAPGWIHGSDAIRIFERLGDADYKLRAMFKYEGKDKTAKTLYWADENGDGQQQPNEVATVDGHLRFSGWYMGFTPDMTVYSEGRQYKVAGFTGCGAPKYELNNGVKMPAAGLGSADGKRVLTTGAYGVDESWMDCYDIAGGKKLWSYPDNFVGVHGSHRACPPVVGMVRGSYGPCGAAKLPPPIGNVWVLGTNVGEWHILTEDGFYLCRLFQGDPMKIKWPDKALPGAILDDVPPGMGGEDFGGSICFARDGKLYLQVGKTGFWNVEVVGLDAVRAMSGSQVTISASDVAEAEKLRVQYLQAAVGTKKTTVKKGTPEFTGDLNKDFAGAQIVSYKKQDAAEVRSAAAWDDQNLYLAWDVRDATAWLNAAQVPEQMYTGGDTVDFQMGTDAKADKNRDEAARGDLRLSIGNFRGRPTAVLYRKVSDAKKPKQFSSGVIKDYRMDYVDVAPEVKIKVAVRPKHGYVVEAAVPLGVLGLKPSDGLVLPADFGVTHGGPDGDRTRLRTYWNNQHTGIVDDVVFELKMEPKNWGQMEFK